MSWVDAVRAYAKETGGKFMIPRKGTEAYAAVKRLQGSDSSSASTAPRMRKERADKGKKRMTDKNLAEAAIESGVVSREEVYGKKARKPRSDKGAKRITSKQLADEVIRQGYATKKEVYGRKPRSDKGTKRITSKQLAEEVIKQGHVSRAEAYGRKTRSDKGKKRGPRKAKEPVKMIKPRLKKAEIRFDEEGNIM